MESSTLMWSIAHDQLVQQRIEAIVRSTRWAGTEDPTESVPVEQLAWAVATHTTIRDGVDARLDNDAPNISKACAGIPEADLAAVITDVALPRLARTRSR